MLTDRIHYGKAEQDRRWSKAPTPHFDPTWKRITLPAPPVNTDRQTRDELLEIRRLHKATTPVQRSLIEKQDKDKLEMVFVEFLRKRGIPVQKDLLSKIKALSEELTTIGLHFKEKFDRARPNQLFEAMGLEPLPEGETTGTPAYPSNHALIGTFLAEWLAEQFPGEAVALKRLGSQLGDLRVVGGWHFPSDVEAGRALAKKLKSYFEEEL